MSAKPKDPAFARSANAAARRSYQIVIRNAIPRGKI
jgi:hypothetical protein